VAVQGLAIEDIESIVAEKNSNSSFDLSSAS